MSRESW